MYTRVCTLRLKFKYLSAVVVVHAFYFSFEGTHVVRDSCTILFDFSLCGAQIVVQDWCRIEIEKVSDGCY